MPDPTDPLHRQAVKAHILGLLAGVCADMRMEYVYNYAECDDVRYASELVLSLRLLDTQDLDCSGLYLDRCWQQAAAEVDQGWGLITTMASDLVAKETLSAREVRQLMAEHRTTLEPRPPLNQQAAQAIAPGGQFSWSRIFAEISARYTASE